MVTPFIPSQSVGPRHAPRRFALLGVMGTKLLFFGAAAQAQDYAFPTSSADYTHFYPTAYYDHAGTGSLRDWNCGSDTYDGHSGNDFGVGSWSGMDAGRDVTAAADGVVTATHDGEYDRCSTGTCGTSNYVTVDHPDGKSTQYVHLRKWSIQVEVGERISCGQKLGEAGSSGNSTGPHLHLNLFLSSGSRVDIFHGSCSGSTVYWVSRGSYGGLPSRTCDTTVVPRVPTAALIAQSTDQRASLDINGDGRSDLCARANSFLRCTLGEADGFGWDLDDTRFGDDGTWNDSPDHYMSMRFGDLNGDRRDDICIRTDADYSCFLSQGDHFGAEPVAGAPDWANTRGFDNPEHYTTIRMLELNGDGRTDLCARDADGIECYLSMATGFSAPYRGPDLSDARGYGDPDHYATLRAGDFTGDGRDDLCIRAGAGMRCYANLGDGTFDSTSVEGPEWSDDNGWDMASRYGSIQLVDLNGDGRADLFARGRDGVSTALSTGSGFETEVAGPAWTADSGWDDPNNAFTLRLGDIDGDGDADLCGRANARVYCYRWETTAFATSRFNGPEWSDSAGWDEEDNYWNLQLADITGDGNAELCGRSDAGVRCVSFSGTSYGPELEAGWGSGGSWEGEDNWPTLQVYPARSRGCPDADIDFACDDVDLCPLDPLKSDPGSCGCFVPEGDRDEDGTCDVFDACPEDGAKTEPGHCGCGKAEEDHDGDGFVDCGTSRSRPHHLGEEHSDSGATADADTATPLEPAGTRKSPAGCSNTPRLSDQIAIWGSMGWILLISVWTRSRRQDPLD
jgi:hypothetical protein